MDREEQAKAIAIQILKNWIQNIESGRYVVRNATEGLDATKITDGPRVVPVAPYARRIEIEATQFEEMDLDKPKQHP